MPNDASTTLSVATPLDKGTGQTRSLPDWFPGWAQKMAELYFSGTTSMFLLHGNTYDVVESRDAAGQVKYSGISEFLAEQFFGRWDLVLVYDLARGLRCLAGSNEKRLQEMIVTANKRLGDLQQIPKDPSAVLSLLDKFVTRNIMAGDKERLRVGVIIEDAGYLAPEGDAGRLNLGASTNIVTLMNWATSPYVKRINMAFVLINDKLSVINGRLSSNPHVAAFDVPLPTEGHRQRYIEHITAGRDMEALSIYDAPALGRLTAGISFTDLSVLIQSAIEGGRRLDENTFRELKKRLIERQAQGFLEFVEPHWTLDMVIGHEAAIQRLKDDAELLRRGQLKSLPMGYLFCGPVGTGKSFLAECAAGTIGIPCVVLKNFRSKYVGETEGNLERVLSVLRAMGPVVVIIDEADTQLGDRDAGGDSGTSSRVFGMIASQMGDTKYRGKIIWMLLTARPDLLPIDIKRQGRAEVHIPLFYPGTQDEIKAMFSVMARKLGTTLDAGSVPDVPFTGKLSGADIEGIVGRAWRKSLLADSETLRLSDLEESILSFLPSTNSLEKELQEVAAMVECTDREFLPPEIEARIASYGGRDRLQERLTALKQLVESM
ncbi:MAG: ATP-dependent zinc metalloprotease FtsH [bacterium]|nr:ATP-dependent zinc metalloprotease FtsH [bacterium]